MPGNSVIGKDVVLISQEVVASELGVSSSAISNWYAREARGDESWGMPEPVLLQMRPGYRPHKIWRKSQLRLWHKWYQEYVRKNTKFTPLRNRKEAA